MNLVLLLITLFIFLITLWLHRNFTYWKRYENVVASASGSVFSGKLWDFIKFKTSFAYHLKTIYDDPKFAKQAIVGIYGLYKPSLLIKEPEIIKSVLIKDFEYFCDRLSECDPHTDPIGGNLMFFLRYNVWKDIRNKLTPMFSTGKLKYMFPLIQKVGENMEKFLTADKKKVIRMEMKNFFARYTTDVMATTMFGFCSNSLQNPDENVYKEVIKFTQFDLKRALHNLLIFFAPKLTKLFKSHFFTKDNEEFLSFTFEQMLAERKRTGEQRNDLINIFVKLEQEAVQNGDDVIRLRQLLLSQLSMFLGAGFETSSTTMSNVLLELAKMPEVQQRLRKDILQAFKAENGEISYETIINMEYLNMIIYETLRLYPVLPVLERMYSDPTGKGQSYSLKPYSGFRIPDGMPVYISTYALGNDPKYWPNPSQFDPERFSAANKTEYHSMVSLPFGNGPHNCIGSRLGLLQIKTGLAYLLRNHYVRVCNETVLKPDFDNKSFLLQVKDGIHLELVQDNMYSKEQ